MAVKLVTRETRQQVNIMGHPQGCMGHPMATGSSATLISSRDKQRENIIVG